MAMKHNLIAKSHPGIVEEPARLILHHPQQNKLLLLEYFNKYEHYLMLKTYIENNRCLLNNEVEQQYFIAGCKHSYFIKEQIRHEKNLPAYKHKFQTEALLVTIAGYLELPNSPTKRNIYRQANQLSRNGYLNPQTTKVHSLDSEEINGYYPDEANIVDDDNLSYA